MPIYSKKYINLVILIKVIRIFNSEKIKKIEEMQKKWQEDVKKVTQRDSYFETDSGIKIKPIYTPADIKDIDYLKDTGSYKFGNVVFGVSSVFDEYKELFINGKSLSESLSNEKYRNVEHKIALYHAAVIGC